MGIEEKKHPTSRRFDGDIQTFCSARRHLTTKQRSAIAAEIANMKMADTLKTGPAASNEAAGKISEREAAKMMSVSRASVQRAVKVKRDNPEAHEAVKAQKAGVPEAGNISSHLKFQMG